MEVFLYIEDGPRTWPSRGNKRYSNFNKICLLHCRVQHVLLSSTTETITDYVRDGKDGSSHPMLQPLLLETSECRKSGLRWNESIFLKVCVHQFSVVDGCKRTFAEMAGCYPGMVLSHATLPGTKHQPTESWVETLPCSSGYPATDDPSVQIKLIRGYQRKREP